MFVGCSLFRLISAHVAGTDVSFLHQWNVEAKQLCTLELEQHVADLLPMSPCGVVETKKLIFLQGFTHEMLHVLQKFKLFEHLHSWYYIIR